MRFHRSGSSSGGSGNSLSLNLVVHGSRYLRAPDNNGSGDPRTLIIDVSAFGNFSSISQIALQSNSDIVNGRQPASSTPKPKLTVTLPGYGSVFTATQPIVK